MAYDTLLREAKDLPEDMLDQVIEFMRFLKYASKKDQMTSGGNEVTARSFRRSYNPLADEFISIADDFDETPECFKEYL